MILAMTAMPLGITQHHHGVAATTVVMQVHVLGMFLPSFFTGSSMYTVGSTSDRLSSVFGHAQSHLQLR